MIIAIDKRLQKLENRHREVDDTAPSDAETLLWEVARNGSDASRVQALKALNELRFDSNQAQTDNRSEAEIRANIERLIAEYKSMPDTRVTGD
ncbi:MAG: hypothetical protein DRQ62_15060 [Gammaproteobacteria bacterium]|nr:MAG: hypothetical protein DRQ62_15060 [Gammaproteobacteria bacterium]